MLASVWDRNFQEFFILGYTGSRCQLAYFKRDTLYILYKYNIINIMIDFQLTKVFFFNLWPACKKDHFSQHFHIYSNALATVKSQQFLGYHLGLQLRMTITLYQAVYSENSIFFSINPIPHFSIADSIEIPVWHCL